MSFVESVSNVISNVGEQAAAVRSGINSTRNNVANNKTTIGNRVQQGLQTASTKVGQGLNAIGAGIVQPLQQTVQKIQTTVIVAIVLVIVLIFGVGVGMFFAGRASVCSGKKNTPVSTHRSGIPTMPYQTPTIAGAPPVNFFGAPMYQQ